MTILHAVPAAAARLERARRAPVGATQNGVDARPHHDFYLAPRDHTASLKFMAILPSLGGPAGWFIPKSVSMPGPKDIPLGTMSAGKAYELGFPSEGFEQLLQGGEFSFVREKGK